MRLARRILRCALWSSAFLCSAWCEPSQTSDVLGPFKIENLPILRGGVQTHQFCSYDRAGDNYDGEYFPLYMEPNGEAVIFDTMGPGCLYRQHMNVWKHFPSPDSPVDTKGLNIRYYFDDEEKPRIDMDISTFFSEKDPLGIFHSPNAVDGGEDFRILYYPICFKKRLKVALSRRPYGPDDSIQNPWKGRYDQVPKRHYAWYQYTYHTFSEASTIQSWRPDHKIEASFDLWSREKLGTDPEPSGDFQTREVSKPLEPGRQLTLWQSEGRGSIRSLRFSLKPMSEDALFGTWLKITFDGTSAPQVEAPLGAFFGANRKNLDSSFTSLLVSYSPGSMCSLFPMPFWKSVKVEVENRGHENVTSFSAQIEYGVTGSAQYPEKKSGHFYARYHKEFPRSEGHDYTYLQFTGNGHVVGQVVSRYGTSMEENERTYFDGNRTPQVFGAGFEDDHGMGWGLKNLQHAVFGAMAAKDGEGSIYRFFVPDLYYFNSSIKQGHQVYGPHSPRGHDGMYQVGDEESVAFFYAREELALVLSDEFDVGERQAEREHSYRVTGLTKRKTGKFWYDGELNNVLFKTPAIEDDGVAFKGSSEFNVKIDPANRGVKIRRRTDKENNRQAAHVYIDGTLVEERPWYSVDYSQTFRGIRWLDTDFEIPSKYVEGKSSIRVKVEYVAAENREWDEYHYWIYSYK